MSALWRPLATPTILLGFLLPWAWGISSWLLQQSTATAPAKHSRCSLPWTWDISLPSPFLTFNVGYSSRPSYACAATAPWVAPPSRPWPPALLLASSLGWLLPAAAPGLRHEVASPGCPWPQMRGSSPRPPPLASDAGCLLPTDTDLYVG